MGRYGIMNFPTNSKYEVKNGKKVKEVLGNSET